MKTNLSIWSLRFAAFGILSLMAPTAARGGDGPQLDALRAARIATDYLAQFGSGAPHIVSLTLERSALLNGKFSWVARWSRPLLVDGNKEVALRVNLDGSTARLVEDKDPAARRHGPSISNH